jgi:dTDP-4-amino-4,6-dideoxygalactose transaminase
VHAAMGLCVLDDIEALVAERQALIDLYKQELIGLVTYQQAPFECYTQPIYMPVQFNTEAALIAAEKALKAANIFPRRYFVPENYKFLNQSSSTSIKECGKVANRVLCLPLMNGMESKTVKFICSLILKEISS